MNGSLIAIIVILVLCLVLAGIIYYAYCRIREKLRDTSRMLFGTDSMIEGMKQREAEVEMTPKSVSSATNLYMPSIMRDFPEFHYDEMKSGERADLLFTKYYRTESGTFVGRNERIERTAQTAAGDAAEPVTEGEL